MAAIRAEGQEGKEGEAPNKKPSQGLFMLFLLCLSDPENFGYAICSARSGLPGGKVPVTWMQCDWTNPLANALHVV